MRLIPFPWLWRRIQACHLLRLLHPSNQDKSRKIIPVWESIVLIKAPMVCCHVAPFLTVDMRDLFVLDPLIGKRQQFLLATQLCRMILKVNDGLSLFWDVSDVLVIISGLGDEE
jgi:hypothetical protein